MSNFEKIENNENRTICAECNGHCCRHHSCETHPRDVFGNETPTIEKLIAFLESGNYQIDWWEGDIRYRFDIEIPEDEYEYECYFVRPAHHNSKGILFDPSEGGCCVFFEDNKGCKLSFEERPQGGKALVPAENKRCRTNFSKAEATLAWFEYLDMFKALKSEYKREYLPNGTFKFTKK